MRASLVALAGAALLAAGCGDDGGSRAEPTPEPPRAEDSGAARPTPGAGGGSGGGTLRLDAAGADADIRALLDRRASALRTGRAHAFAATAAGSQRARDRRAARRARRLPLRDVRYVVDSAAIDGARARMRVRSAYRVAGAAGRHSARRTLLLRRTAAGWRVARERTARERHPWELAAFRARRTGRFLVLAPPGIDAGLVGATLEAARVAAARRLEATRLGRRLLVVVAADAMQARALTGEIRGVEHLAAVTDAEVRTRGPERRVSAIVSVRLVVPWTRFAALDPVERERVVAHELTHAALVRHTSGRTPAWLQEGVALYTSRDRRVASAAVALRAAAIPAGPARRLRPGLDLRGLSAPDAIARLHGDALPAAYAYASAAAHFIADRHGEARLRGLYAAFNDPAIDGGPGPRVTDAALRAVLGVSLRRFERRLRRWTLTVGR